MNFFFDSSTKNGIYKENCGLANVLMTWGHDGENNYLCEYIYYSYLIVIDSIHVMWCPQN